MLFPYLSIEQGAEVCIGPVSNDLEISLQEQGNAKHLSWDLAQQLRPYATTKYPSAKPVPTSCRIKIYESEYGSFMVAADRSCMFLGMARSISGVSNPNRRRAFS